MKLKSFGCSFIFGTDLSDTDSQGKFPIPSRLTWPGLMAKDRGWEYQCYARPGSGNLQITDRVLQHASEMPTDTVFVIGWTYIDRFDYNPIKTPHWETITPGQDSSLNHVYYRDLHSQYRDMITSLIQIKLVKDTLEQKKIPYLMTYQDELLFETNWYRTGGVGDLQDAVKPVMQKFEGQTFTKWAHARGFEISETSHPLEPAHQAAFELMRNYNFV